MLLTVATLLSLALADVGPAPVQRRGTAAATATAATPSAGVTSARAATNARTAPRAAAPAAGASTAVAARAGTTTAVRGAAKTAPVATSGARAPAVSARAATTQKVIGTGTKVVSATSNNLNSECQQKYNGCMDAFCVLDNSNGGRCLCSDKIFELDKQLAEIEKQDQQSYQMATVGVEIIETGVDIPKTHAAAAARNNRTALWEPKKDSDAAVSVVESDEFSSLRGSALQASVFAMCIEKMPECADSAAILQAFYQQQIRSDCTAYENSLKQQKTASAQKLAAAEQALREAALEQLHTANKYDLGQCTIEFKKCMASTGGCKEDFTGCVGLAAAENATRTSGVRGATAAQHVIKGTTSQITIAASTYDTLLSKKPLCESVTKSCVAVADQVWDTFLREIAPTMKSAELIAESNLRTSCISNISECFQKACKDTMDPNDPDGSYDMCLSRPETIESLCKVQIDPCKAAEPMIMDFVKARLASMRVDSCTTEVKECLQSSDRCGSDYTQCVGLDTNTIIRMCPYDKLTGCQKVYGTENIRGDAVYDELAKMVQGIMLNIDNNMLTFCQNALNESMLRVCGDTENCNSMIVPDGVGARSLEYKVCQYGGDTNSPMTILYDHCVADQSHVTDKELGRVEGATSKALGPVTPYVGLVDGTMYWELISVDGNGDLTGIDTYAEKALAPEATEEQTNRVMSEIAALVNSINNTIKTVESDPTVQFCMTGRRVQGMREMGGLLSDKNASTARFPSLSKQMKIIIANSALKQAKDNYYKKYDELTEKRMRDLVLISERQADILGENGKDARREAARQSCVDLARMSAVPKSKEPPKNPWGQIIVGIIVAAAIVVACVFTFGGAAPLAGIGMAAYTTSMTASIGTAMTAGVGAAGTALAGGATAATAAAAATAGLSAGMVGATTAASAAASSAIATAATAITASAATVAAVGGVGTIAATGVQASQQANGPDVSIQHELTGRYELEQFNYKETITTDFQWETLNCHKCVTSRVCEEIKDPMFGTKSCKTWADAETKCTDIQF